jgi:hypothetical protein
MFSTGAGPQFGKAGERLKHFAAAEDGRAPATHQKRVYGRFPLGDILVAAKFTHECRLNRCFAN